jgi:uncharacterized membrane protein
MNDFLKYINMDTVSDGFLAVFSLIFLFFAIITIIIAFSEVHDKRKEERKFIGAIITGSIGALLLFILLTIGFLIFIKKIKFIENKPDP